MKNDSLSNAVADTVASPQTIELAAEIADVTLDQAIGSELLKDIPVLGWLAKGVSAATSISDRLLFGKILRFLTQLEYLNSKEKYEFTRMVEIDRDYRRKVGERLILALDRMDEPAKSEMLARCFDYYLTGYLDYEEFSELAHVIDRSFLTDLQRLRSEKYPEHLHDFARMQVGGLALMRVGPAKWESDPDITYSVSPTGRKLQRILRKLHAESLDEMRRQREREEEIGNRVDRFKVQARREVEAEMRDEKERLARR